MFKRIKEFLEDLYWTGRIVLREQWCDDKVFANVPIRIITNFANWGTTDDPEWRLLRNRAQLEWKNHVVKLSSEVENFRPMLIRAMPEEAKSNTSWTNVKLQEFIRTGVL